MKAFQGLENITAQITRLLDDLPAEIYSAPIEIFEGASIGQHCRHIYEFYACLARSSMTGALDYSDRQRDPALEKDKNQIREAFQQVLPQLAKLDEGRSIRVKGDLSVDPQASRPEMISTMGREMTFVHDHAVHHLAIIRIGLRALAPDFQPEAQLGLAPATIKHQARK